MVTVSKTMRRFAYLGRRRPVPPFVRIGASIIAFLFLSGSNPIGAAEKPASASRPNVLFIVCDDLNDTVEGMGGHPQARTPNISRLIRSGVRFTNAHSAAPICGPSRASLWSGLYPHTTGLYGYDQNKYTWRDSPVLKNAVTVFEHFTAHGYRVYATGKIFHDNHHTVALFRRKDEYDRFGIPFSYGPFPWDGVSKTLLKVGHPSMKAPWGGNEFETFVPLSDVPVVKSDPARGLPGFAGWRDRRQPFRYVGPGDRDLMSDEKSAAWVRDRLREKHERPFFLTLGLVRPHCPWVVPDRFFDLFPLEDITLPPYLKNDLDDCGPFIKSMKTDDPWYTRLERLREAYSGDRGWKRWIRGYLASVAFADEQLGIVLDALAASPYKENTIVVFTSDHGFHMGEKQLLTKKTVWEESTRVPLIVRAPGVTPADRECGHPVSLIDLYPTLVDLCNLPNDPNKNGNGTPLDGHSLRPFLEKPDNGKWDGPVVALSVIDGNIPVEVGGIAPKDQQHFTVRSRHWRYCLWSGGEEELYDHRDDPHEWHNLADRPEHSAMRADLRGRLRELAGR